MKISFNLEITPEEIFSIGKLIEEKIAKEVVKDFSPVSGANLASAVGTWIGKTVKIKAITPDSEIASWASDLKRDITYGVTQDSLIGGIKIQGRWYPKIWFELAG